MEDKFMMDSHKLIWHLDRVNKWKNDERIAPLHIDLGITTGCNIACTYCYGVLQGRTGVSKRFDMPEQGLLRLLKDAKEVGVRSIAFDGQGENTLNEALYSALNYAKEINLDIGLATNGTLILEDKVKDMLSTLTWIRFNISAASPESYLRIHRANMFDTLLNNIKICVDINRKNQLKTTIGMQMVLMWDNVEDIVPLAKLGQELGVDYLVIKPCSDDPDKTINSPTIEYLDKEYLLKQAQTYSKGNYNVVVKWDKFSNLGIKDFKKCYGTRFLINISGDGTVFPCGHFFNIRKDEFQMGNILEMPFSEIIKSNRYWEVQKKIENIDVNSECETNCRHYYLSKFLWSMKNPPSHVNFI
jgi:radical SAM protein with 4Fe4S-binding SPASM domain